MGTKFASLHLRTNNIKEVVDLIQLLISKQTAKPKVDDMMSKMYSLLDKDRVTALSDEQKNSLRNLFLRTSNYSVIDSQNGWVSILNENYAWESIEREGLEFSKMIDCPIMAIGYFDDDVFEIDLIKNNKVITKHVVGNGLEFYEVKQRRMNVIKFIKELQINISDIDLRRILEEDDIFNLYMELESRLGLIFRAFDEDNFKLSHEIQGCKVFTKRSGKAPIIPSV